MTIICTFEKPMKFTVFEEVVEIPEMERANEQLRAGARSGQGSTILRKIVTYITSLPRKLAAWLLD
ncbi:hypothetical protein MPTK1_7g06675 [Marchantia polymorpha subsp. ruderalis]|uniref:Uncharacterized protein n=2 Tax=Marchantia polymorpha TaxID=3197 RepID=A0A679DYL5_MARPO|nr:hypothetical protein MARPO_0314s0002 [Marchantia polymorpha]BBN20785.1 hypothetical protein Mp_zg01400 [Marchantia polymorpha subsp. ruderalis]|eukprot:PTQ26848.1 hypothetical protein MARPO_0314s0002 [Marchantia polymorpha]